MRSPRSRASNNKNATAVRTLPLKLGSSEERGEERSRAGQAAVEIVGVPHRPAVHPVVDGGTGSGQPVCRLLHWCQVEGVCVVFRQPFQQLRLILETKKDVGFTYFLVSEFRQVKNFLKSRYKHPCSFCLMYSI